MSKFTHVNFPGVEIHTKHTFDRVNKTGTPGLYARPMLIDGIREARRRDPA